MTEAETSNQCAPFITDDWEPDEAWMALMRCPACGGWLPRDWTIGAQFQCKRCGAVLETLPSLNPDPDLDPDFEEDTDYRHGGRLCVVPEIAIKIAVVDYPIKRVKKMKVKTNLRAIGHTWTRRVWEDEAGRYIEIGWEKRIPLSDPRILSTVEDEA